MRRGRRASRPAALRCVQGAEPALRAGRLLLLLLGDLGADLVHVEGAHLADEVLERRLGQRAGLGEEQNLVPQDHEPVEIKVIFLERYSLFIFSHEKSEMEFTIPLDPGNTSGDHSSNTGNNSR